MKKAKRSICPVACALDVIGDKWTLLVVRDMACGKRYFNDFCRSPEKIATNILTDRLQRLVDHGLACKRESDGRDCYQLTPKGRSLEPVIGAVAQWGLTHIQGTKAAMKPAFD